MAQDTQGEVERYSTSKRSNSIVECGPVPGSVG
jgi:hypothetical protein